MFEKMNKWAVEAGTIGQLEAGDKIWIANERDEVGRLFLIEQGEPAERFIEI